MALFIFILFLKLELRPLTCTFQGHETSVSLLCNFSSPASHLLTALLHCYQYSWLCMQVSSCRGVSTPQTAILPLSPSTGSSNPAILHTAWQSLSYYRHCVSYNDAHMCSLANSCHISSQTQLKKPHVLGLQHLQPGRPPKLRTSGLDKSLCQWLDN